METIKIKEGDDDILIRAAHLQTVDLIKDDIISWNTEKQFTGERPVEDKLQFLELQLR